MNVDQIHVIERLRAAAREHGEVFDLLMALQSSLVIDGSGTRELVADGDEIEYLKAVLVAADFVAYDSKKKVP